MNLTDSIIKEFRKKWDGGNDGLFFTEPLGSKSQRELVESFLRSALEKSYKAGEKAGEKLGRKIFIDEVDHAEWGVSDEEAGENYDEALSKLEENK